jgi:hypothetical protein
VLLAVIGIFILSLVVAGRWNDVASAVLGQGPSAAGSTSPGQTFANSGGIDLGNAAGGSYGSGPVPTNGTAGLLSGGAGSLG